MYNRPRDAFVAQFLGPINLLHGQVDGVDSQGEIVVKTPLGRLVGRGSASAETPQGASVSVSIRPEALGMSSSVPPNCNRFQATIDRKVFSGELRRIHLRGPGDWPLVAHVLQSQSSNLREGQSVTVHVSPEQVVILQGRFASKL